MRGESSNRVPICGPSHPGAMILQGPRSEPFLPRLEAQESTFGLLKRRKQEESEIFFHRMMFNHV